MKKFNRKKKVAVNYSSFLHHNNKKRESGASYVVRNPRESRKNWSNLYE